MSTSTVSITANPAARRRPVVVGEKKSNNNMEFNDPATNNNMTIGDNDKLVTSQSKDLTHHSILERTSKDIGPAPLKRSPRRTRKVVSSKPERPRWLTVVSVFTKNFVLLLVLIGLVQMIRKLALKSSSPSGDNVDYYSSHLAAFSSESEARIARVESLFKTSLKMIQLQVEVVDKKIDNEVGGLRRDLDKKVDERGMLLDQLVARLDGLDKSLSKLKAVDWLSREDFNKFVDEFMKKRKDGLSEQDDDNISLDDIRAYAKDIVLKEIEKHAADGLGMVDYALASGGAMVVKHSDPFVPGKMANWLLMTSRNGVHPDAVKILKPSFGEPGQCFPLKGSSGFVQIRLRTSIIPQAVTLEHVSKSVAYDRSSAPKDCRVSGWLQGQDTDLAAETEKVLLLTEFTYDLEKGNAQTFGVLNAGLVDTVRLDFASNHGSSSHTCIYRLRVHGDEPDSLSMMRMEP